MKPYEMIMTFLPGHCSGPMKGLFTFDIYLSERNCIVYRQGTTQIDL